MKYKEDIEKIIESECNSLVNIYQNLYDNVNEEMKKSKRGLKIRKYIYWVIWIGAFLLCIAYYDEVRRFAELSLALYYLLY